MGVGEVTEMGAATPVIFSWSAGKDSAFGLWTLLKDRSFDVRALLTTLTEGYDRVTMSGVRDELLDRQAAAIGLPVIKVWIPPRCANEAYERRMASTLAAREFEGVDHVAFADLFLRDVREYREERLGHVVQDRHGLRPIDSLIPEGVEVLPKRLVRVRHHEHPLICRLTLVDHRDHVLDAIQSHKEKLAIRPRVLRDELRHCFLAIGGHPVDTAESVRTNLIPDDPFAGQRELASFLHP
jgi:hypothetical protein